MNLGVIRWAIVNNNKISAIITVVTEVNDESSLGEKLTFLGSEIRSVDFVFYLSTYK